MTIQFENTYCLEMLAKLENGCVDMILIDPPYGSTNLAWDKALDYSLYFPEFWRVLKPNGIIIITSQQPYVTDVINACRKFFKYEIIWNKVTKMGFLDAKKKPLRGHENILVFYKHLPVYNPQFTYTNELHPRVRQNEEKRYDGYGTHKGTTYVDTGKRYPSSILTINNWNGLLFGNNEDAVVHPTQKPVALFRYLIKTYTNEGGVIFDGFCGSGTTAIACIQEKRNFIGCEANEKYYTAAVERIKNEQKKLVLF